MARLISTLVVLLSPLLLSAQTKEDDQFKQAGVCARCHVISVVEWGVSKHSRTSTTCTGCHGESEGHVIDERNNIKPERIPHGQEISTLCATCHAGGCPKSKHKAGCQTCHHYHALLNPKAPAVAKDVRYEELSARFQRYDARMAEGEKKVLASDWSGARAAFQAALQEKPGDARAAERARMCERRLKPALAGFEITANEFDPKTGLPKRVRIAGLGIPMVLVPGGEVEIGTDKVPAAKPVHTVSVAPFYLSQFELTQAEWNTLMGSNPSVHQGNKYPEAARMPVENISWQDCRKLTASLNQRVPGAGFRLPSEAEWEFAARAADRIPAVAEAEAPQPVGKGLSNRLGLYDMQGNVWEWTSSLASTYPYSADDGRENPAAPGLRILRGGGFADAAVWYDPGARHSERPTRRLRFNGVRIARSVPE